MSDSSPPPPSFAASPDLVAVQADVATPGAERDAPGRVVALHIVAVLGALGAIVTLGAFWLPLVLAAWFAQLARPLYARLSHWMRGRGRSASLVTVLLVVAVLSPVAIVLLTLTGDAVDLLRKIDDSPTVVGALTALTEPKTEPGSAASGVSLTDFTQPERLLELAREHGMGALGIASRVLGVTASVLIGLVVFVTAFYNNLIHGRDVRRWILGNSPLSQAATERFIGAFQDTGNGLLVAVGLTALIQGVVAGVGYLLVGVPHGLVLGLLTAIAALVPSVGTGLVWGPVALGLLLSGRSGGAIAILVIGVLVSSVDNILRPMLSRLGNMNMPTFVLFLALLGGMVAFGPVGVVLGPLLVRLGLEGLALSREQRASAAEVAGDNTAPR